jgi:hypothetical protein
MQYEYALYVGYTIVRATNPRAVIFFCALQWLIKGKSYLCERECYLQSKYTAAWDRDHNEILIPTWIQYLWHSIHCIMLHHKLQYYKSWRRTSSLQCISSLLMAGQSMEGLEFLPPSQKFQDNWQVCHVRTVHKWRWLSSGLLRRVVW